LFWGYASFTFVSPSSFFAAQESKSYSRAISEDEETQHEQHDVGEAAALVVLLWRLQLVSNSSASVLYNICFGGCEVKKY
jgi:hypothetical protein